MIVKIMMMPLNTSLGKYGERAGGPIVEARSDFDRVTRRTRKYSVAE